MKAAILAGGKGTRLLPYTIVIPKPMLPIGGYPVLEIIARQLKHHGFDQVVISLGHLSGTIENYVVSLPLGEELPKFSFYHEDFPLGTSGAIPFLFNKDDEDMLVINGDIITTLNMRNLFQHHKAQNSILTLGVRRTSYTLPLGSVQINDCGNVLSFVEKPTLEFLDNIGVYVYSKKILKYINPGERLDVNELVNRLINANEKVSTFLSDGLYFWIDIGTHADYEKANSKFSEIMEEFPFLVGFKP